MKLMEAAVRRATGEDVPALSTVMADALMARPVAAWLVPKVAERPLLLHRYAHLVLKRGFEHGQVDTTDDHAAGRSGIRGWEPPAPAASWVCDLQRHLGSHAPRFALLHAYVDAVVSYTPLHYLAHLAVRPGPSGAVRALLAGCHRRFGYEPRSLVLLEPGGPALWRPARGERRSDGLPCRVCAHRSVMPMRRRAVPASPRSP